MEYWYKFFTFVFLHSDSIMQQLTINIPDNKIAFFIDLAKNLGFTIEKNTQKNVLTEKQIELVDAARKQIKENPDSFLDWDEARKTLNVE